MAIWGAPRLSANIIGRERLTRALDGHEAIVVLHAPAGYGKTVALAQWAGGTSAVGVWSRVREDGTSAAAFVQQISDDLCDAGLIAEDNPLLAARDALLGGMEPWRLLQRGLRALSSDITLALDQIDKLGTDVIDALPPLLTDVPGLRIRATARRLTPLSEAAIGMMVDARLIGADQLAMTPEEAGALLGEPVTSPAVRDVIAHGGAPLLARSIALMPADGSGGRQERTPAAAIDSLLRLRARSERWDPDFIDFLLRLSPADAVTLELAQRLSGSPSADVLLDRAEEAGLGMWSRDAAEPLFVLSPFIRDRLEHTLERDRPAEVSSLRRVVASWATAHGQPYTAMRLAVAERDWDAATEVARVYWYDLLRGHRQQLQALFAPVSVVSLRRRPLITMLLALAYNASDAFRLRAVEYFAVSALGAREQRSKSSPPDRALLRTVESAAMRVSGRIESALSAATDAYDVLMGMSPEDRERLGRNEATLFNQVGTTFFYAGRTDAALESFRRAASGLVSGARAGLQGLALHSGALAISGDMPEALAMTRTVEAHDWPPGWIDGYPGSFYQIAAASLALERFDVGTAERHVRSLDPHRDTIEHWSLLLQLDSMILLLRHEPERALLQLAAVERTQRRRRATSTFTTARLSHTRALLVLAAGDAAAATRILSRQTSDPVRTAVGLARIALARQDPELALRQLQGAPAERPRSARTQAEFLSLRAAAVALAAEGAVESAMLERTRDYLVDRGQSLALALVPRTALQALGRVAEASGDPDLMARVAEATDQRVLADRAALPRLTPRERAVAEQLARSRSNAELASILSVSENTVKSQLRSLYGKLGVANRGDALRVLAEHGVIEGLAPDRE